MGGGGTKRSITPLHCCKKRCFYYICSLFALTSILFDDYTDLIVVSFHLWLVFSVVMKERKSMDCMREKDLQNSKEEMYTKQV